MLAKRLSLKSHQCDIIAETQFSILLSVFGTDDSSKRSSGKKNIYCRGDGGSKIFSAVFHTARTAGTQIRYGVLCVRLGYTRKRRFRVFADFIVLQDQGRRAGFYDASHLVWSRITVLQINRVISFWKLVMMISCFCVVHNVWKYRICRYCLNNWNIEYYDFKRPYDNEKSFLRFLSIITC